jgi:hypothetical protein
MCIVFCVRKILCTNLRHISHHAIEGTQLEVALDEVEGSRQPKGRHKGILTLNVIKFYSVGYAILCYDQII